MKKQERKTAVFYNEGQHHSDMGQTYETTLLFKEAKNSLEAILENPIEDYKAFRTDLLGYSIAQIKNKFPKAFELGLPIDKTLQMLSIDLRIIERADGILKTTPHRFNVCPKTGDCTPDEDKEPYIKYITTDEQHERFDFASELIKLLDKAHTFKPETQKANLTNGLSHIIYFDPQVGFVPNHFFVAEGIQ